MDQEPVNGKKTGCAERGIKICQEFLVEFIEELSWTLA